MSGLIAKYTLRISLCLLLTGLHASLAYGAEQECVPLPIWEPSPQSTRSDVKTFGRYCLQQDISAKKRFDIHAGGFRSFGGEGLISVRCLASSQCDSSDSSGSYTIDLRGHRLVAEPEDMVGIENLSGGRRVTILNGQIDVPGRDPSNIGIRLRPDATKFKVAGRPCALERFKCEDIPTARADDQRAPEYTVGGYVVDKVTVKAGWRGVQMGGSGNVLRNSVIDVDGRVAVYQFGPGAVIENNTFIVRGKGDRGAFDAVLKLRDAHGALVRNNTFIFRGGLFSSAPAAINLLDSSNVQIEGNSFKGFDQTVRVNGASTYVLK